MKIGFIGLGIMGKPMVRNLIKAGHELTVYGHGEENMAICVGYGAKPAASPGDAARGNGVAITMLPNSPNVRDAVMGENGVLETASPGTVLIDMSSIAPRAAREIAEACSAKGVKMLDAPVSGGEPGAAAGTLAVMVGGDRDVFESVKDDVLLKMGSSAAYCGPVGAGNTAKLVNQAIVAVNIAALAEGLALAEKSGVDPRVIFEAIRGGLAGSAVMEQKTPMMIAKNFKPGFKVDLHIKDLANVLDAGHDVGSPLPLAAQVMEMLQTLHADGRGREDHSSLAAYYAKLSRHGD